jgi:PTH1 family peptidyl-tRNA hydrolase
MSMFYQILTLNLLAVFHVVRHQVLDYFKLPVSSVLVVVDEVALDIGQIRLRQTGSAGGHNGLKSIESCLKCKDYNRLRIGVGGGECW